MRNFSETGYRFSAPNVIRFIVEELKTETDPNIIERLKIKSRSIRAVGIKRSTLKIWFENINDILNKYPLNNEQIEQYRAERDVVSALMN